MKRFVLMLQFFTRIPLNFEIKLKEGDFEGGIVWFPAVGFVIGLFNLSAYLLSALLLNIDLEGTNLILPALICVLANLLITGAMQLDGFADSCDGLYSSRTKERMLEIMKDSRTGTFGAVGIFMNLALRTALIISIGAEAGLMPLLTAIIIGPVAGKAVSGFLIAFSRDARAGKGMGGMFIGRTSIFKALICLAWGVVLSGLFIAVLVAFRRLSPGFAAVSAAAFLISIIACFLFKASVDKKIGGMTGDTIGAASEIADITFSLALLTITGMTGVI